MKVQLLSDLHLERQPDFLATPAPGADVLVLAGDIGSYQARSRLRGSDFGLEQFAPRPGAWKTVLYVPGNHEYDGLEFDEAHRRLRETCERLGITWLERAVVTLGTVRFIGTTLWSDFDALAHGVEGSVPPGSRLAWQLAQREKAFRAANFYLRKYTALRQGELMMA
ncbi:MAG TPA: metallophosphoesterase, partial [Albitalea sp.]|nr:metallophosphoesterase [Albitalea sp.]